MELRSTGKVSDAFCSDVNPKIFALSFMKMWFPMPAPVDPVIKSAW